MMIPLLEVALPFKQDPDRFGTTIAYQCILHARRENSERTCVVVQRVGLGTVYINIH